MIRPSDRSILAFRVCRLPMVFVIMLLGPAEKGCCDARVVEDAYFPVRPEALRPRGAVAGAIR